MFLPLSEILLSDLVHLHIKCARPVCAFFFFFNLLPWKQCQGSELVPGPGANLQAGFFTLRRQLMGKGWISTQSLQWLG